MCNSIFKKSMYHKKGQALVELMLAMSIFLFIVLALWEVAFLSIEQSVGKYAAFMTARSYQVYGNAQARDVASNNDIHVYKYVGQRILSSALPYLDTSEIEIEVDTAAQAQTDFTNRFPNYNELLGHYGIDDQLVPQSSRVQSYDARFGLMKVSFKHRWFSDYDFSVFDGLFNIYTPYRLEPLAIPDFG